MANLQIKTIEEVTEKRNRNAALYDECLADLKSWVKIPPRMSGVRQSFHTYVVQVENRNKLIAFLEEKGVETKIHYPIPIHLMEAARQYGYAGGDFPVAETQATKIVSLPVHHHLTETQVQYVVECRHNFYAECLIT